LFHTPRAIYGEHPGMSDRSHLTGQALTSSPVAIPVSHSQSPGSAWARKMTATYGQRFADWYLKSNPADACLKMLLATSTWASTTCYLTWKKSATPQGRLLFRLSPSTPRTAGIGSGLWGTPTSRDHKDGSSVANVPENGLLGRQAVNRSMLPTPRAEYDSGRHRGQTDTLHSAVKAEHNGKLNSAWVSRMMGYPDDWLTLDGEETP